MSFSIAEGMPPVFKFMFTVYALTSNQQVYIKYLSILSSLSKVGADENLADFHDLLLRARQAKFKGSLLLYQGCVITHHWAQGPCQPSEFFFSTRLLGAN